MNMRLKWVEKVEIEGNHKGISKIKSNSYRNRNSTRNSKITINI